MNVGKEILRDYSLTGVESKKAVELGLADDLASLDQVARDVIKAEEIVDYSRHDNVAERLVKRFGAAMGEGAWRAMRASTNIR